MPNLVVCDLKADAPALPVIAAGAVDLGGTIRQVSQKFDKELELATWICQPRGMEAAGLIVIFHGGPCKSWADWPWRWNPWPFVHAGFAVMLPDPPMSSGYGNRAIDAGWQRWRTGIAAYAKRQVETVRCESALSGKPLILMGGSFGGYLALTVATILQPDLVIAHGAPADLQEVALNSDVSWQWTREYGRPGRGNAKYRRESIGSLKRLKRTKILLSHGLNDDLVPVSHAIGLCRRLRFEGVESTLAVFDDEHHGLARVENQQGWFRWIMREMVNVTTSRL